MVIDALNSEAITRHHFEALGFFSPALQDYVNHGLFPNKIGTPEYQAVLAIEDPYNYRDRPQLKMPKFLINASGDQFFLPDSSQFYFKDLLGIKYLRYVPNADHGLKGSDAWMTLLAVYSLGLAIPFLGATIALDRFMASSGRFRRWLPRLQQASGVLVLIVAVLLLTDSMTRLAELAARFEG